MGAFHDFETVQMVPNRAQHYIFKVKEESTRTRPLVCMVNCEQMSYFS